MYEKRKKSFRIGINQINKQVLLSIPKLITVGEGTPSLMTS